MGYSEHKGIKRFQPDDDANTLYFESSVCDIVYMLERIRSHFGEEVEMCNLKIEAQYIHTDCLTYDQYDPGDWTNFIMISRK